MSDEATNGNGKARTITLALILDLETHQVGIGGEPMPLSLAQMICDEGARVLAEQRRIAVAQAMQQQMAEAQRTAAILGKVRGDRV